jgi:hypothetical protein
MTPNSNAKTNRTTARLGTICLLAATAGGILLAIGAEFRMRAYAKTAEAILSEARWLKSQLSSIESTVTSIADLVHNAERVVQPLETPTSFFVGKGQVLRDYTEKLRPWVEKVDEIQDFLMRKKGAPDTGNLVLDLLDGLNGLADGFDQIAGNLAGGVKNTRESLSKTEGMLRVFTAERIPKIEENIETVESIARTTSIANHITRFAYWILALFLIVFAETVRRLVSALPAPGGSPAP